MTGPTNELGLGTLSTTAPFIAGRPVEPEEFVGRKEQLVGLFSRLRGGQSIFITGPPRVGKSSLLRMLMDQDTRQHFAGDQHKSWIVSLIDVQRIATTKRPGQFWHAALAPLRRHPPSSLAELVRQLPDYPMHEDLTHLFDALEENGLSLVLLLDEADAFHHDPELGASFWQALRADASYRERLTVVLASRWSQTRLQREIRQLGAKGSEALNQMATLIVPPFTGDDVGALFRKADKSLSHAKRKMITRLAGPMPKLLQETALRFWEHPKASLHAHLTHFEPTVDTYFDEILRCAEPEEVACALLLALATVFEQTSGEHKVAPGLAHAIAHAKGSRHHLARLGLSFSPSYFDRKRLLDEPGGDLIPVLFALWVKERGYTFLTTLHVQEPTGVRRAARYEIRRTLVNLLDTEQLQLVAGDAGLNTARLTFGRRTLEVEVDALIDEASKEPPALQRISELVTSRYPHSRDAARLPGLCNQLSGDQGVIAPRTLPDFMNDTEWQLLCKQLLELRMAANLAGLTWVKQLLPVRKGGT